MRGWMLVAAGLLSTTSVWACDIQGRVVKVTDGDTVTVLDQRKTQHKIRLAGIDAPERKQPYGQAARKILTGLIAGKQVCVESDKKDKYGRIVGKVLLNGADAGYTLVAQGYAWHYKRFQNEQHPLDRQYYAQAEIQARSRVIGLWQEPNAIPPWDWRKGTRTTQRQPATPTASPVVSGRFSCGGKRFCKQMTSCAEARFYLTQCNLQRLDRDRDGIPCESIC